MARKTASIARVAAVGLVAVTAAAFFASLGAGPARAEQAPGQVTINLLPGPKKTAFSHEAHAKQTPCKTCHHSGKNVSCAGPECHGAEARGEVPDLKAAFHKQCIPCHRTNKGPAKCAGADGCHD